MFLYKHFLPNQAGNEMDDIVRNVGFILRSKDGCSSFLRSFGISETGQRTPEEMIVTLSREIREALGLYEPRIEIVEIEEVFADDGRVSLQVSCRMRSTKEPIAISVRAGKNDIEVSSKR